MANSRVGIVILTFNRADVVIPCLRSLVQAKTDINFEVFILDNDSKRDEYELIKKEFDLLKDKNRLHGVLERSDYNTGFPKGNNIGIKYFLNRPDITHLCLLNSDVIVTDYWLDYLVNSGFDVVGPVTNACGNEQTIPIPFQLKIGENNYDTINQYAKARHDLFAGYFVKTDFLGFFCFLIRKSSILRVGLLDEQFGRGAFEDDDYCHRLLRKGYEMHILRDVLIYHWGSSSFSQIPLLKLLGHLKRNRRIFERKYGIVWSDRKLLPVVGFNQDLHFALGKYSAAEISDLFEVYFQNIYWFIEYLSVQANKADGFTLGFLSKFIERFDRIKLTVKNGLRNRLFTILRDIAKLLFFGKTILFPVHYPNNEDLKDGYYQRVKAVDAILSQFFRVYLKYDGSLSSFSVRPKIAKIEDKVYEFTISPTNVFHHCALVFLATVSGTIYLHSILRLQSRFHRLLYFLSRRRILDIHGVVPEEFLYHAESHWFRVFTEIESYAIKKATIIIGVTQKMIDHLKEKHRLKGASNFIHLPILPDVVDFDLGLKTFSPDSIIYCGGLQKWQQVDRMLDYIHKNKHMNIAFLVPQPNELRDQYQKRFNEEFPGIVESAPSDEVPHWYNNYSFGLVLREDVIVSNAACPTKLVEYLQYGVVPIVDSPNIGDFNALHFSFVGMNDNLPDESKWEKMIQNNKRVINELYLDFINGSDFLINSLR